MSHYTVLVVGDDVEGQLEPYDENREVAPYKKYLDDKDVERMIDYYRRNEGLKVDRRKKDWQEKLVAKMEDWTGCEGGYDEDGIFYWSTYNPDSKWDWYSIGGRWRGFFRLKKGKKGNVGQPGVFQLGTEAPEGVADQARKGDIDWKAMTKESIEAAESAWDKIKEKKEDPFCWGHEKCTSKEDYVKEHAMHDISTFAVVKDGRWYEKGRMGWWAIVTDAMDEEEWQKQWSDMVMNLPDDTQLTVVDCHI